MHGILEATLLILPGLLVLGGLMIASGFFSASETALFYLSRDELRAMYAGKPHERLAAELLRDPDRLLTAILFWNLATNLTYFAVSVVVARQISAHYGAAAGGVVSFIFVAGIIVFGEVVPKSAAVIQYRRIAVLVSWPLAFAVRALDPLLPALGLITRAIRRTIWPNIRPEPYLHVDDLEKAVEFSNLSAETIRHEQQVLQRILELSEITVEEVMRPRGTYAIYSPTKPLSLDAISASPSSLDYVLLQDPTVSEDDPDAISGAIPLASLWSFREDEIMSHAERVAHVPWCAPLAEVLQTLRDRLCDVAVVVNEYGETMGVVTYEDVMETVLVPLPSRVKRILRREPMLEVAAGRFHVDGLTTLRYLAQRLGLEYEPTADGLLTVTGMLQENLERLPQVGDELTWNGYRFTVIESSERGQVRVMLTPIDQNPQNQSPGDSPPP